LTRKKKYFVKIKYFLENKTESFWTSLRLRELSNSLRFSYSEEYTLASLDFLDSDMSILNWRGKPYLPLQILLSKINGGK
jgi:hypothetical protein